MSRVLVGKIGNVAGACGRNAGFDVVQAKTNLDHWQAFEEKYPFVFAHMYKFWVQKRP